MGRDGHEELGRELEAVGARKGDGVVGQAEQEDLRDAAVVEDVDDDEILVPAYDVAFEGHPGGRYTVESGKAGNVVQRFGGDEEARPPDGAQELLRDFHFGAAADDAPYGVQLVGIDGGVGVAVVEGEVVVFAARILLQVVEELFGVEHAGIAGVDDLRAMEQGVGLLGRQGVAYFGGRDEMEPQRVFHGLEFAVDVHEAVGIEEV